MERPKYVRKFAYFKGPAHNHVLQCHGIKYQGLATPDGLIRCMFGPLLGITHDALIMSKSGLLVMLSKFTKGMLSPLSFQYALYGDSAYAISAFLLRPFKGIVDRSKSRANYYFSTARISVEWQFGLVDALWQGLLFRRLQKLWEGAMHQRFMVAVFLSNIYVCMYGRDVSNTCQTFNTDPPTVEEYLWETEE